MISESGTNAFHGKLYDFVRNQVLDANNWFANLYGQPIPGLSAAINMEAPSAAPSSRIKPSSSSIMTASLRSIRACPRLVFPAPLSVPATLARCARFTAEHLTQPDCVLSLRDRSGIRIPERINPNLGGRVASTFIPFNNMATYASPGSPYLDGTPYQLSGTPGDLIDPVAQKMINMFPMANINNGNIYDNWIASGSSCKVRAGSSTSRLISGSARPTCCRRSTRRAGATASPTTALATLSIPARVARMQAPCIRSPSTIPIPLAQPCSWIQPLDSPVARKKSSPTLPSASRIRLPIRSLLWAFRNI